MTARVQNKGLDAITTALVSAGSAFKYLQWGSGSGAAATANAVTTTSTTEARTSGTLSQQTSSVANDQLKNVGVITAAGTVAITELGLFDAAGSGTPATGGNMDAYFDFAVVNLSVGESISFTATVTFS